MGGKKFPPISIFCRGRRAACKRDKSQATPESTAAAYDEDGLPEVYLIRLGHASRVVPGGLKNRSYKHTN